jgi:hypothetical protein
MLLTMIRVSIRVGAIGGKLDALAGDDVIGVHAPTQDVLGPTLQEEIGVHGVGA